MHIKNFSKSYRGEQVFKNFDLEIEEGAVTCILAPSGAGKTTLLNAIAGLIPYEGQISPVKCSYIFQEPRLVPSLTVRGNLKLVCPSDERIDEMLRYVQLSEKAESYPVNLSGGQAQRVSVARGFLYKSEVILMDEPFSSLDLKLKRDIIRCFNNLRSSDGRTAVFVTHDVDEAVCLADRLLILNRGNIVFDRRVGERCAFGASCPLREEVMRILMEMC